MLVITHYRAKCIGCNYCVELDPQKWRVSQNDGKAILVGSKEKRGFFTLRSKQEEDLELQQKIAEICPVKIIQVSKTNE